MVTGDIVLILRGLHKGKTGKAAFHADTRFAAVYIKTRTYKFTTILKDIKDITLLARKSNA